MDIFSTKAGFVCEQCQDFSVGLVKDTSKHVTLHLMTEVKALGERSKCQRLPPHPLCCTFCQTRDREGVSTPTT